MSLPENTHAYASYSHRPSGAHHRRRPARRRRDCPRAAPQRHAGDHPLSRSADAALTQQEELLAARPDSAALLRADLLDTAALPALVAAAEQQWGRLDALINNASSFYPTAIGTITETQWDDLMGSNLKASLFLSQAAAPLLAAQQGNIVNIVDIHAERPLKGYPLYCAAKAGLAMLTKALARELAPTIRVNAVAPGAILWPEHASEV